MNVGTRALAAGLGASAALHGLVALVALNAVAIAAPELPALIRDARVSVDFESRPATPVIAAATPLKKRGRPGLSKANRIATAGVASRAEPLVPIGAMAAGLALAAPLSEERAGGLGGRGGDRLGTAQTAETPWTRAWLRAEGLLEGTDSNSSAGRIGEPERAWWSRLETRLTYVPGFIGRLEYRGAAARNEKAGTQSTARFLVVHPTTAGRASDVLLVSSSGDPGFDRLALGQARLLADRLNEFGPAVEGQRSVWTFEGDLSLAAGALRVRLEAFYVGRRL